MGASLYLAGKLSISSTGGKTSPAVRVAVTAVALSTLIMLCAIAIVMGFKHEITEKVSGFNSHISISAASSPELGDETSSNIITLTPSLKKILDETPYISDFALQASAPAIFKTPNDFKGIYLKTLSGKDLTGFLSQSLVSGIIPEYSSADSTRHHIVISSLTASQLGLKAGDEIDTYFITDQIRVRRLKIAGIFNSHFDAYDDNYAYASLPLVQEIGATSPNQGTSIAISTQDFSKVDEYAYDLDRSLRTALSDGILYRHYDVTTARQSGASYFQWLEMLDMNVVMVLILMAVVACVTLVSGMLILMVDKVRFIALMRALGAPRKMISRVFVLLAGRIALYGLIIGNALALGIILFQRHTHILPLDADSYYIDFVPMKLPWTAAIMLNIGVLLLLWIVLILPSRFAGKAAPARTLTAE